jgi:hypothetical protein
MKKYIILSWLFVFMINLQAQSSHQNTKPTECTQSKSVFSATLSAAQSSEQDTEFTACAQKLDKPLQPGESLFSPTLSAAQSSEQDTEPTACTQKLESSLQPGESLFSPTLSAAQLTCSEIYQNHLPLIAASVSTVTPYLEKKLDAPSLMLSWVEVCTLKLMYKGKFPLIDTTSIVFDRSNPGKKQANIADHFVATSLTHFDNIFAEAADATRFAACYSDNSWQAKVGLATASGVLTFISFKMSEFKGTLHRKCNKKMEKQRLKIINEHQLKRAEITDKLYADALSAASKESKKFESTLLPLNNALSLLREKRQLKWREKYEEPNSDVIAYANRLKLTNKEFINKQGFIEQANGSKLSTVVDLKSNVCASDLIALNKASQSKWISEYEQIQAEYEQLQAEYNKLRLHELEKTAQISRSNLDAFEKRYRSDLITADNEHQESLKKVSSLQARQQEYVKQSLSVASQLLPWNKRSSEN